VKWPTKNKLDHEEAVGEEETERREGLADDIPIQDRSINVLTSPIG